MSHSVGELLGGMSERLILALMALWVARVTGDCDRPPTLENGSPTDQFVSLTSFPVGTSVDYKCYPGYVSQEGRSIITTCLEDSTWTPLQVTCKLVSCQRPPLSENIEIESGFGPIYRYRDTISYRCKPGYVMVGNRIIECSENNTFVPSPPTCKLPTFSPAKLFKEMIALGRQLITKEENTIKAKYQLLESEREILRLKENLLQKAEQYVDEGDHL